MKIRKMKKNLLLLLAGVIFFTLCTPLQAEKSLKKQVEREVITVAILKEEGINNEDLKDEYINGYSHAYLKKIEQFSPIKFEYIFYNPVDEEILGVLNQVKEGKIDLLGGILKNSGFDEGYLFSDLPYGYVSTSLLAKVDNMDINERVLLEEDNIRIGIIGKSTVQKEYINNYIAKNKINPIIVEYDSNQKIDEALMSGEIDLMIGRDTTKSEEVRVIVNLAETPYYFVTAENNKDIMNLIDDSMRELEIIDPEFIDSLYEKYYSTPYLSTALTSEEKRFIQELGVLKVGVIPNDYPLQYYDTSTKEFQGILIDLMNLISENTGLKIEYVQLDDLDNIKDDFENGVIDMLLGIPTDYSRANINDYLITSALVNLPVVRISNSYASRGSEIAMSGYLNLNKNFTINYDDEDLFKKIADGKYKEAYIDGYRAQYFSSYYPNVSVIPSIYENYELAIGLYNKQDYRIMSILEQGIRGISQHKVDDIIYNSVNEKNKYSLMDYFRQNPFESIIIVIVISTMLVGILLMFLYKSNQMKKDLAKERKKYEYLAQFDQLTKVYNQQTFKNKVQSYIEKKSNGSIISMDLDNFKNINDSQGHFEGDRLLEEFGRLLKENFGEYITGRLGGDEFMVYLDAVHNERYLRQCCETFLANLNKIEKDYELTISIGILIFNEAMDFDDLYYRVDKILYNVKDSGRNNIKVEVAN